MTGPTPSGEAPCAYPPGLLHWYAEKEADQGWTPYHIGTTPGGSRCSTMPRVVEVEPGMYRCPACGKRFPTARAELARMKGVARGG